MSYPPPPGYGAPGGYPPQGGYAAPQQSNGLAIAALVTGILSIFCFPGFALAAIPLGIAGMGRAKKLNGNGRGLAIGGLVTGIIGVVVGIAVVVFFVVVANEVDDLDFRCGSDETSSSGAPCRSQGEADPTPEDGDGVNSDPDDNICNVDRFFEDPDC